jgi:hypothetical protein
MPKKIVTGEAEAGERLGMTALPTWQATGLSLAVIVGHVFNGSGALVFGLLSVGVIWTLHRLHTHAPGSRTTADLIASVSGATPARAIAVVQFVAYALIGAYTAKSITSMALPWMTGPDTTIPGWSGPALGVATAAVGCLLVGALPTRLLAPAVTVLAAFSLLVFFYVALAVIARVLSGTAPVKPIMEFGTTPAAAEWGPAALLISLAIAFAGFEIPTSASDRLRSVRRPLGGAMALATLCAALAWVATNLGSTGEFRYDAADLVLIAGQMFGGTGTLWLLAAAIAGAVAAHLGRDARRPTTHRRQRAAVDGDGGRDGPVGAGGIDQLGRWRGTSLGRGGHPPVGRLCGCRSGEFASRRRKFYGVGTVRPDGNGLRGGRLLDGCQPGLVALRNRHRHCCGCSSVGAEVTRGRDA